MLQAMGDYAELITELKAHYHVPHAPVIGFGGSYGGMLAAWCVGNIMKKVVHGASRSGLAVSVQGAIPAAHIALLVAHCSALVLHCTLLGVHRA